MSESRLPDYLSPLREAAADACGFIQGFGREDFLDDKRTQQAVIMSLIIIGEAATKTQRPAPDTKLCGRDYQSRPATGP